MRIVPLLLFSIVTAALIIVLNSTLLTPIPLGSFLSPQHGMWQNADSYNMNYNDHIQLPQLRSNASVYFDERMVPHIFAQNEEDALFIQGYIHARFRLWQMEFQTHAAAGRLSEIVGERALDFDRSQRRLGMVYGAENSLREIEADSETRLAADSYTAGVNAYIETLNERSLPIEYKLLGYRPEKWSNLKSALFLKYMALDLAGHEEDFEMSNARAVFSSGDFNLIYPIIMDSLDPIVPKGTVYEAEPIALAIPESADSLYYSYKETNNIDNPHKPDKANGSNNWAVSGSKTATGAPILASDPHLGLNLPALWYEMQISTPDYNAYGATFPGAPHVIIGFNDDIAFGFTNGMRDVRDYYEVIFKDESRSEYRFNDTWMPSKFRIENILIKDKPAFMDTVAYTHIGPVMYDKRFTGGRGTGRKDYAVRWKAHDASNELKVFYLLNRATNYNDYVAAIRYLHTPGQNVVFASKSGDIAIWAQGQFPAKWYRQGDFVMPGNNSDYFWQYNIPEEQNPHQVNPERGFVSSANQLPTDTAYPYYLGGAYPPYRGFEINRRLEQMNNITVEDMLHLQVDNYNVFGEIAAPELIKRVNRAELSADAQKYFDMLATWDFRNETDSRGTTIFVNVWDTLESIVWKRILPDSVKVPWPHESTLIDLIKRGDSSLNILANLDADIKTAIEQSTKLFANLEKGKRLEWAKFKDTQLRHLTQQEALSVRHLNIGGGEHVINATKHQHGPSWRMVVSMTDEIEAYGIYPGGQSGNPGSRYYDDFSEKWARGEFYRLWVMKQSEAGSPKVIYTMRFSPKA